MSTTPAPADVERELEEHRPELIGYCYRMLASPFEAEDAVHETMLRARATMDEHPTEMDRASARASSTADAEQLERFARAFERYDVGSGHIHR